MDVNGETVRFLVMDLRNPDGRRLRVVASDEIEAHTLVGVRNVPFDSTAVRWCGRTPHSLLFPFLTVHYRVTRDTQVVSEQVVTVVMECVHRTGWIGDCCESAVRSVFQAADDQSLAGVS